MQFFPQLFFVFCKEIILFRVGNHLHPAKEENAKQNYKDAKSYVRRIEQKELDDQRYILLKLAKALGKDVNLYYTEISRL